MMIARDFGEGSNMGRRHGMWRGLELHAEFDFLVGQTYGRRCCGFHVASSGNLARPRGELDEVLADTHWPDPEDARVHVLEVGTDARLETHMGQNVLLQTYPRGDLGQGNAAVLQLEHGAFGNVGHLLAALRGQCRTKADLAD